MRMIHFIFHLLIVMIQSSFSTHIECLFRSDTWTVADKVYVCNNQNYLNIISPESAVITSSTHVHMKEKINTHVTGYVVYGKRVELFPQRLDKVFGNLKGIYIQHCALRKIQNSDLRVFPYLLELSLGFNRIDVLEDDVFNSNPNLQYIMLSGNSIFHIGLKVFDHLNKLSHLRLAECYCINQIGVNGTANARKLIKEVKEKCFNIKYDLINTEISKIENESQICKKSDLDNKLQKINQMELSNSDMVRVRLERMLEKNDLWCTKEKLGEISSMLQNLNMTYNNLNKQLGEHEAFKLHVVEQEDDHMKKLEKLQMAIDQLNIRMLLIGASALFVTIIIIIAYSKAIF